MEDVDPENVNPLDFTEIDSLEKAESKYRHGELSVIYLFPPGLGGVETPQNAVYVPHFVEMFKERFDHLVEELRDQGKVTGYSASPEYKGKSFIPSALMLEAKGIGGITERIEIW